MVLPANAGPVRGVQFLADVHDAAGVSVAWAPESDWQALPQTRRWGAGEPLRAPYPASLLKLMLAVGLAWGCQLGSGRYEDDWTFEGACRPLRDWQFDMLALSCNRATSAAVAWLHACGAIRRAGAAEAHNELHALFGALDLPTLRLANTQPDGGWGNAAGAGVGQIQMSAWDSLRLRWGLDPPLPGRLLGGKLAAWASGLASDGLAPVDGAILFVEDRSDDPYRVRRHRTQPRLAGQPKHPLPRGPVVRMDVATRQLSW